MEIVSVLLLAGILAVQIKIYYALRGERIDSAMERINRDLEANPPKPGELRHVNLPPGARLSDIAPRTLNPRMTPSEISRDLEEKARKRAQAEAKRRAEEVANA